MAPEPPAGDVTVRWLGAPPNLLLDVLAALESLQREVQVTGLAGEAPVGSDVERGMVRDRAGVQTQRDEIHDRASTARNEGRTTVDVVVRYAEDEVPLVLSAAEAADAVDRAAHRGELLVPPLTDDERHLWSWMVAEIRAQAGGAAPTPYWTRS